MIGQMISHYLVRSQLGAGGMGVVYEAEDTRLGRRVAIKLLRDQAGRDPEAVQRFAREARAISALNHPCICTLYDIGEHAGQHYMVMELLEGESLKTRVDRGPLPFDQVLDFGAQMADALDAAHASGLVHRDIKPANLFITHRGRLKVLDFGVAKLIQAARGAAVDVAVRAADDTGRLTTRGEAVGTVMYMSPEQARGQDIDARSDLFSAGIVLAEMATGRVPFPGSTPASIFEGILTKEPPLPSAQVPGIPAEFDHIVLKALEKDRETRYQGAAELRADLKRLRRQSDAAHTPAQGTVASSATAVGVTARAGEKPRRGWFARGAMIGAPLLTLAVVGGTLFLRSISAPALTEKDPVVLADVVNRTGDVVFDDTLGEALGLQLRQSPFLRVVADQKVRATLRLMGRDPAALVTAEVGREVCQRLGAKALMGGSIAMLGSAYVVALSAEDCVSGIILAEEQVQAGSKEKVLEALGNAVSVFRERLGESLASIQRYDAKIEQATTPSLEALKAYGQGVRTRQTTGDFESVPFFKRAIELDPEFALAYARLGTVYANLGQMDECLKMTERAFELRQKVSEAERLYIEARYYTNVKMDVQKAIDTYRLTLATYPGDYPALNNLGLLQKVSGDTAGALRSFEEATRVAPDQALAWMNLGSTYIDVGRYDEARRALETSLKLQDSTSTRVALFAVGIVTGDRALADAQVEATRGRRGEVEMLGVRIAGAMYRGRLREAAALTDEWQPRMAQANAAAKTGAGLLKLAVSEAMVGLDDAARIRAGKAKADHLLTPETLGEQLTLSALLHDARAARTVLPGAIAQLKKDPWIGADTAARERSLRAVAALAEGRAAEAVELLEPLTFDVAHTTQVMTWSLAQLDLRQWEQAAKGMAWLDSKEARVELGVVPAVALASLARAQAAMGQTDAARKTYQKFFDLWKEADADVPLLLQARQEFEKLEARPQ